MSNCKAYEQYSLSEWLLWIEKRSSKKEIRLGLSRIRAVAQTLRLLSNHCIVIAVSGTNGKGSTVAMLEAIYCAAGYSVGAYTSPHLLVFNERIRLNQKNITDAALCEAFCAVEGARGDVELTYFETTTLAALWYFKQQPLNVMILEVGIGGRLDATNIMDSDLAIITTVDLDHQEYLGNTRESIGFEKAGIMRSNQWFVYADTQMPDSIGQQAKHHNVAMRKRGQDYFYAVHENHFELTLKDEKQWLLAKPRIHLSAAAAGIIGAYSLRDRLPIEDAHFNKACLNVKIAGRTQVIYDTICVVLDVSHNSQSVSFLKEKLQTYEIKGRIHAVFSGLEDKDLCSMIKLMHTSVDCWYCAELETKRRASETQLRLAFNQASSTINVQFCPSIIQAYETARKNAKEGDWIVVFGSFYVVSAIMLNTAGHGVEKAEGFVCNG